MQIVYILIETERASIYVCVCGHVFIGSHINALLDMTISNIQIIINKQKKTSAGSKR